MDDLFQIANYSKVPAGLYRHRRLKPPPHFHYLELHPYYDDPFLTNYNNVQCHNSLVWYTLYHVIRHKLATRQWSDALGVLNLLLKSKRVANSSLYIFITASSILKGLLATNDSRIRGHEIHFTSQIFKSIPQFKSKSPLYQFLILEYGFHLVYLGQCDTAFEFIDPLAHGPPYCYDLHILGLLGMICIAKIQHVLADNPDSSAASTYVQSARYAFASIQSSHEGTPTYLPYHLFFLKLTNHPDTHLINTIHKSLSGLANIAGVLDRSYQTSQSAVFLEFGRRRRFILSWANRFGFTLDDLLEDAPDPFLSSDWVSDTMYCLPGWTVDPDAFDLDSAHGDSVPMDTMQYLAGLLQKFDFAVHDPVLWRRLVVLLSSSCKNDIIQLFSDRSSWWFTFHLNSFRSDPVDILVYKTVVMFIVIPNGYRDLMATIWQYHHNPLSSSLLDFVQSHLGVPNFMVWLPDHLIS